MAASRDIDWFGQGAFAGPPMPYPRPYNTVWNVRRLSRLDHWLPINKSVRSRISSLCFLRRPAAVLRRITSFIVDAIKRQSIRAFAHIGKEILKGLPPLADRNAAPAVFGIGGVIWVEASVFHSRPSAPRRRALHPVRSVALTPHLRDCLALKASTTELRATVTPQKLLFPHDFIRGAAVAPDGPPRAVFCQHNKTAKSLFAHDPKPNMSANKNKAGGVFSTNEA